MSHPPMTIGAAIPILQKRAGWLASRLAKAESEGRVLAYDRVELMALLVVIEYISSDETAPSA
jgi:hypothetical protein